MINKLLIANRGEIALRILRACKELEISTVAVYSEADRDQMHVKMADESICIGPAEANKSYLNIPAIISSMELSGADGVHPGYGFLAENSDFAEQVEKSGYKFAGPSSSVIKIMGNKISAKRFAREAGLPTLPDSKGPVDSNPKKIAKKIGYPLIIKAASGGGGRGMRVVNSEDELEKKLDLTKTEAIAAFGDEEVYLEKFLTNPRHIEIQVLSDRFGNFLHLGDRDCSMQRRHQKIIEEAPSIGIPIKLKEEIYKKCISACKKLEYVSAGTFEFLYQDGGFYFIEMNTRLQVEHPVTESITGLDIVKLQLRIASDEELRIKQEEIELTGHSIECRINAEHSRTFTPSAGLITGFHAPGGIGVRVDSHIYNNYRVPPFYDSLIAKVICRANDREDCRVRLVRALDEMYVSGIDTNIDLHRELLVDQDFVEGKTDLNFVENKVKVPQ